MDYMIAPKASFDATADAIREKTGSQEQLTWGQDGFAAAITPIKTGYTLEEIGVREYGNVTDMVFNGVNVFPHFFEYCPFRTFLSDTLRSSSSLSNGIGQYVFAHCENLEEIHLGVFQGGFGSGGYQFAYDTKLTTVDIPHLTGTGQYAFRGCTSLVQVTFPKYTGNSNQSDFAGCTKLEIADFEAPSRCYTSMFNGCTKLATIIFRSKTTVPTLSNINAFTNTPFASGKAGGTLIVPRDMIDRYTAATNWSTILGYATNSITALEDSPYANTYANGVSLLGDGINLLTNSGNVDFNNNTFSGSTAVPYDVPGYYDENMQPYYASSEARYIQVNFPDSLVRSAPYTISFEIYRPIVSGWLDVDAYVTPEGMSDAVVGTTVLGEWVRLSYTFFACPAIRYVRIRVNNVSATGANNHSAAFRHFKLEKGVTATAWTEGGAS